MRQSGALKLVFPRRHGVDDVEAVAVNSAGGITGGDRFFLTANVGAGAHLRLTTQAAERVYRAQSGSGQISTQITVGQGAKLHWLPQETILFEGGALRRRFAVDMAQDAQFLLVEPLVFGRQAMGEDLSRFLLDDRIIVRRAGLPLYLDGTRLTTGAQLQRGAQVGGARAAAQVVMVGPMAAASLPVVRSQLPATAGASLIGDDLLVVRMLAADSFALRQDLLPILDHLTDNQLPTSWRL